MTTALDTLLSDLSTYKFPAIEKERLDEADFVVDAIDASNFVRKLIGIVSSLVLIRDITDIEKAILMGHMTYLYKLYDSLIFLINENRREISLILTRTLSEVAIRLRYLIGNITPEICEKIIKSGLAYDKKVWNEIESRMKGGKPSAIEKRMQDSILKKFQDEGFTLDNVNFKNDKDWAINSFEMAVQVGMADVYEFMYRIGITATHASWSFHKRYNLIEENGTFKPQIGYSAARPQIIEGCSILALSSAFDYINMFPDFKDKRTLTNEIKKAIKWYVDLGQKHEEYLQGRK